MTNRLKSLELNGFKTFANKTRFEFSGQITAIVGPNGSGKSNIADALRWVLGEQSYRLLRARKTEDMIFSGSETRPKSGMASVSLVFDNTEGWLPIDFTEVSITRRAYRDGANEYLINNQRVRLRDINELLSNSGLAQRTYTVIGQGLVDVALSLKAEERRKLFEEAAGIGLYRTRKDQSLNRLEKTRRNLERVEDILSELGPRLRSLQRQARRAQEYEQVKADLKEVLREWYGYHWHKSQDELRRAREYAREQEKKLGVVSQDQGEYSEKLNQVREMIQGLRARTGVWHRQLAELHGRRETNTLDLAVGDERQRALEGQIQALVSENNRLEEDKGKRKSRILTAVEEVEQLKTQEVEASAHGKVAQNALHERESIKNKLQIKIERIEKELTLIESGRISRQARVEELNSRISYNRTKRDELHTAREGIDAELAPLHVQFETLSQEQTHNESIYQNSIAVFETKVNEAEILSRNKNTLLNQLAEKRGGIAGIQAQIEVLDQAERSLTGYASGTKVLLEASRQSKVADVLGSLSSQIEIPTEYETAIAAVLGDYIDAVLIDGGTDIALDIMMSQNTRGALLPLEKLQPQSPLEKPKVTGCIGIASGLVKSKSIIRPALDLLLGNVLVVDSRENVSKVLRDQPIDARAVTLAGEVFYNTGQVIVDAEKGAGILARPRQQRELQTQLEASHDELHVLESDLQDLIRTEIDFNLRQAEAAKQRKDEQTRAENSAAELQKITLKVDKYSSRQDWQKAQDFDFKQEQEQAEKELMMLSKEGDTLKTDVTSLFEELDELKKSKHELVFDEEQNQVTYWNTQLALSHQALEGSQTRLKEREQSLAMVQAREAEIKTRLEKFRSQKTKIFGTIQQAKGSEGSIGEEIQNLQDLIQPAEQELKATENEQQSLESSESQSRQTLHVSERHHTQAQISLARKQESLDSLRQRIEDDFGLVDFEYDESVSGPTPLPLGNLVEKLPKVTELSADVEKMLTRQRAQLRRMGAINPEAQKEFIEVQERYEYLTQQVSDLTSAEQNIREVIAELDELMERDFRKTFDKVAAEFREIFTRLFGGGSARLVLTDDTNLTETGIDIEARLPGKRSQRLALLSGGERSLTATALVFALLKASPTPFCVLDEVDAMLDEANVARFRELLTELSKDTQFVVITHNRGTVQAANVIYGITIARDTVSQMVSLKLDEVDEQYAG